MNIIKRDGQQEIFDPQKIESAINKALLEVDGQIYERDTALDIAETITNDLQKKNKIPEVEEIQDMVEDYLMRSERKDVAKAYIRYRYKKEMLRHSNKIDKSVWELLEGNNKYWNEENSNKNAKRITVQRDYMAGIISTDITRRFLLDLDIVEAHDKGLIHFHDADYFAQNALTNCELINLEDMLQNGTVMNGVMIEKPHRLITATTIATQIIAAVTSSTYGGATITLTHLAPFVRESYNKYYEKYKVWGLDLNTAQNFAHMDTKKEIEDAIQTFNYQTNSMTNTNGQTPFISVFMYLNENPEYKEEVAMLIEEVLKQRITGFKNEKGVYITPAFPKLLYVLEEDNIKEGEKYWYLTELAAKCSAKRLVPDYISEKVMKQLKNGDCYACMGCRSFLTPDRTKSNLAQAKNYEEGIGKYWGRFNQGVVTINLADAAFSSNRDMNSFWRILDERLELCHRALQIRHERLSHVSSDVAPILWRDGALARLGQGESIHKLLHHGYSTLSLGYAALYECVKYMTKASHTGEGKNFAIQVMQKLNDKCNEWKQVEDIDYSVYGTPIESVTYKFATCLKNRFGQDIFIKLDGKDRNYITNSYHVPVFEDINAFDKLTIESEFQRLSPGGAISYIESANLQGNIPAVLSVIQFIYDNIMYAELNTKSDYCQECSYDGEILINEDMQWYCPNCGNMNHETLNVARRTCGYIGTQFWNYGRTQEIKDRVIHLQ